MFEFWGELTLGPCFHRHLLGVSVSGRYSLATSQEGILFRITHPCKEMPGWDCGLCVDVCVGKVAEL